MRHIFDISPHIAFGSAVLASFFLIRSLIAFVLKRHKGHADGRRAVERLRNLPRGEQLVAQPVADVPLPASDKVEASDETLPTKPFVSTETSPPVSAFQQLAELHQEKPPKNPRLPSPVNPTSELVFMHEKPANRQTAGLILPIPIGSKVWAICKLGSVNKGTPGIITGVVEARFFWQSPKYQCTFANNVSVLASPKDIELYNHGHSLEDLKQPDLNSILSRRMTLRAQQLFFGNGQRIPFAGPTRVSNEIAE
jgi:hypothetical protein